MRVRVLPLILLVFLISSASALRINTEVKGVIVGYMDYLDYRNVSEGVQEFTINWVNTGSVGCRVRFRFDVMSVNSTVYTAWTKELPLDPGASGLFRAYWLPDEPGDYTAKIKVYSCKLIEDGPELNFTAVVPREKRGNPFNITIDNDMESVKIIVKSNVDLERVAVIPENYPLAWIVESEYFNVTRNEPREVQVRYFPEVWHPEKMGFVVVSGDGSYEGRASYTLRENRGFDIKTALVMVLGLLCLMLSAAIVFMHTRKPKISQKRAKKGVIKSKS